MSVDIIYLEEGIKMKLKGQLNFKGGVSLRLKHHFSKQHHWTARNFSEEAAHIENFSTNLSKVDGRRHRAYVTGAILFAVAALEASINEFYLEAQDRDKNTLSGLNDSQLSVLANQWVNFKPFFPVLKKYQEALKSVGQKEFDQSRNPFEDTDSLVYLRNALIHYKPEWDDEAKVHQKIKARLHKKFSLNTFSKPKSLWFPHQCLGAGCAKWSVDTIESFMLEFCKVLGIPNRFE